MDHKNSINLVYASYLAHHGIIGMHWGVKNGPPYPLDAKVSARIQRGENEKARYTKKEIKDMRSGKTKTTKKDRVGRTHRAWAREHEFVQGLNASDMSKVANVGTLIADGELPESTIRTLHRPKRRVVDADILAVNPGRFDPETRNDRGYSNNCGLCSAALALRAMGYDVQASRATDGTLTTSTEYYFDGAVPYKEKSPSNIQKRLESFGAEGFGVIDIRRANGGGHAVYFQNERQADGSYKPVIIDGQARARYTSLDDFIRAEGADIRQFTRITRLDRATPNWSHIGEDSAVLSTHSKKGMQVINTSASSMWDSDNVRFQDGTGRGGITWATRSASSAERATGSDGLRSVKRANVSERDSKQASNLALDRSRWTDEISNLLSTASSAPVKSLLNDSASKTSIGADQLGRMIQLYTNKKIMTQKVADLVDYQKAAGYSVNDRYGYRRVGHDAAVDQSVMRDYYQRDLFNNDSGVWQRSSSYTLPSDFAASLRDTFSKSVKDISTIKSSSADNLGNIDELVDKWKSTPISEWVGEGRFSEKAHSNQELVSLISKMHGRRNW